MRASEIFERWYVARVLGPALGAARASRRMAELAEIRDRLLTEATIAPTADVLDVSCGYGLLTWPAAEEAGHAIGVEPDAAVVAAARTVPATGAALAGASPARLPFSGESFDVVIWRGALARDPAGAAGIVAEARRVLRPEGRLCFAEPVPMEARPADPALRTLWDGVRPAGVFHRAGIERLLLDAGFDAVHARIERRRTIVEDARAAGEIMTGAVPASIALAPLLSHAGMPPAIVEAFAGALAEHAPTTLELPEAYVSAERPHA